jgi:DNA-binding MarR family transcriptional regulator
MPVVVCDAGPMPKGAQSATIVTAMVNASEPWNSPMDGTLTQAGRMRYFFPLAALPVNLNPRKGQGNIMATIATSTPELIKLFNAVNAAREIDEIMPTQHLATFLAIAIEEGQTITEIGKKAGLLGSASSRAVNSLADYDYRKKVGLKLVEFRQSIENFSQKPVYLTDKGRRLADKMAAIIRGREK